MPLDDLESAEREGIPREQVQQRIVDARERQLERQGCINAELTGELRDQMCALAEDDREWLLTAIERLQLSARAYHRVLKIARTIADLQYKEGIERSHLLEALSYRTIDRYLQK